MGWALIGCATGGHLLKLLGCHHVFNNLETQRKLCVSYKPHIRRIFRIALRTWEYRI